MNILIIEDEFLVLRSLTLLLKKKGHLVDGVASGREAIELIKSKSYDRILCDLMLQDITGFDILEESRGILDSETLSKKFILMTAYTSPQVIERAKIYKCPLLNKPFPNMETALKLIEGDCSEFESKQI